MVDFNLFLFGICEARKAIGLYIRKRSLSLLIDLENYTASRWEFTNTIFRNVRDPPNAINGDEAAKCGGLSLKDDTGCATRAHHLPSYISPRTVPISKRWKLVFLQMDSCVGNVSLISIYTKVYCDWHIFFVYLRICRISRSTLFQTHQICISIDVQKSN